MRIQKVSSDIFEVVDFLSELELSVIQSFIENASESESWNHVPVESHWHGRVLMVKETSKDPMLAHFFMSKLEEKVASFFENYIQIHDMSSIIRYRTDDHMDVHRDNVEKSDHNNVYGVVLYVNDDYEGGEIYYPDSNIEFKPKKNSMVIHPAGLSHGVRTVTGGVRYVLTTFVRGSDKTSVKEK